MRTNQIYTAYVSWGSDGKRRPVLIVEDKNKNVFCYRITSKYKNKSERIKKNYFPLMDWKIEGLDSSHMLMWEILLSFQKNMYLLDLLENCQRTILKRW